MRWASLLVLLVPSLVSADAIRAPSECPEAGWIAQRHGHSAWCTPRSCEADADCIGGGSCQEIARCWSQSTYGMGRRRWTEEDGPRPTAWKAGVRCTEGACSGDDTCRTQRECVYPEGTSLEPAWRREDPPASVPTPEPEPEPEAQPQPEAQSESETQAGQSTSTEEESGCSVASTSPLWWLFLLAVRRRT